MNRVPIRLSIAPNQIEQLKANPLCTLVGRMSGNAFEARILIPDYDKHIEEEYADCIDSGLMADCSEIGLAFTLNQFGLRIAFSKAVMIEMYDESMTLEPNARRVVDAFGPLFLENAYLPARNRTDGHNAKFEHLNFHRDRGSHQKEQISIYLRDPFDEIQAQPRTISTLFMANVVACLQNKREGGVEEPGDEGLAMRYKFFDGVDPMPLFGKVILEQPWTAGFEIGEIGVIDNNTIVHSSFYRNAMRDGYKIGVRYLV